MNEDGLVARNDLSTADGMAVTWEYSYRAETYEDGSLKAVIQIDHQANDFSMAIMEFDRAGYLNYYCAPNNREVRYYYE